MPIVRYCDKTVSRRGSAIVLSDRALATSHRLSIVTMFPSAAVWPQLLIKKILSYEKPYLRNGER